MKKIKLKILLITLLLISLISTISKASYNDTTMTIVEKPTCTINFGTNSYIERSVIAEDLDNKNITLQLAIKNNEENLKPSGEIMLVIDNSKSMLETVSDSKTREDLVIDSAKTLITNLLENNEKLKIGVVSFSTNSDTSKEGTSADAKLVSELTNNTENLISSVSSIQYDGPRTNLDAGITLAKQYFTNSTDKSHKYVIILSDGVPNVAIDYDKNYYSDDVISKTKSSLESLSNVSSNVFVMLTGISNGEAIASPSTKTYNEIISGIFGTASKPTIGKFYYITDYFSDEITNNFTFSYVKEPSIGKISSTIDKSTKSITWSIPELKSGKTAIVQYKLQLNENYDTNILNKTLNTNNKLDLTYTNYSNSTETKTSDITPKLKLTENLPTVIPKAGSSIFFGAIGIILIISLILGTKYIKIKNSMK